MPSPDGVSTGKPPALAGWPPRPARGPGLTRPGARPPPQPPPRPAPPCLAPSPAPGSAPSPACAWPRPAAMATTTRIRWGDTLDEDDALPPPSVSGPDNKGVKTITDYKKNDKGETVKLTTKVRLSRVERKVYEVRCYCT